MGWMSELYKTYENCSDQIAKPRPDGKPPLLPISHTLQRAHVEMELDTDANIINVRMLGIEEADTILPCTEDSASRTSGPVSHMLYDNLLYIAGDGQEHGLKNKERFENYLSQLSDWCASAYCTEDVRIIKQYLERGTLIGDLVAWNILFLNDSGQLKNEWTGDKKNKPLDASKTLVRFRVVHPGKPPVKCNENTELFEAYQTYYLSKKEGKRICYVTGNEEIYTDKHLAHLRNGGDNAKLVSSNDSSDFTYRGRFKEALDAVTISYEVSQKAHHALRWLIGTQGWKNGEQTILVWGTVGGKYPNIAGDSVDIFGNAIIDEDKIYSTREEVARKVENLMKGYGRPAEVEGEDVVVMALEAATPGRLSIRYYNEMRDSDFIENLRHWYSTCIWDHDYKSVKDGQDESGKQKYRHIRFTGTPAPEDIVFAAFGNLDTKSGEKIKRETIERLLPCISDKKSLPRDIVNCAVKRASHPVGMEHWQWTKTLSIACALVKKYREEKYEGERWDMELNTKENDRSYLFGRLLACADNLERFAQWAADHDNSYGDWRVTNAIKFQEKFEIRPKTTFRWINRKLIPYKSRLHKKYISALRNLEKEIEDIMSMFQEGDFSDAPLDGQYLMGYYCQMKEFRIRREKTKKEKQETNQNEGGNE